MKRFWAHLLFAVSMSTAISAAAFAQSASMRQVYVKLQTGNDDLRSDSRVSLVLGSSGGADRVLTIVEGRRLADGTLTSRVIGVDPPIPVASIVRVGIKFEPGECSLPCQNDQWEMLSVAIHNGGGPTSPRIWPPVGISASAETGRHKFTAGGTKTFEIPVPQSPRPIVAGAGSTVGGFCSDDATCNDGRYCNGTELCRGGGCVAGTPPCGAGISCNEEVDRCERSCPDRDGDGAADAACGGSDCDDRDADRYPGNVERMDPDGHDEDCDPNTQGAPVSSLRGVQVCNERGVALLTPEGGISEARCPSGTTCIPQPNGHGICAVEPPGYSVPPRYTPARVQGLRAPGGVVVPNPDRQQRPVSK